MATITTKTCTACDGTFSVTFGPTRTADNLTCDRCGQSRMIGHGELGDAHLRYIKGLGVPWSVSRMEADRFVREHYPGEPLDRAGYEQTVEASLAPCDCGGRLRYAAPPRCPTCRSTEERWIDTPDAAWILAC